MHRDLIPDLLAEIDKGLQHYAIKVKSGCRTRRSCIPTLPALNWLNISFQVTIAACHEGILQLCETTAYKVIFHDLSHVLMDALFTGEIASSRIGPFIRSFDSTLERTSSTVHNRVRNCVTTALMKSYCDGFLLVLPSTFSRQDALIIEDHFLSLKDMYQADGDGATSRTVDKASSQVKNMLPPESLIERFKRLITETNGLSVKSKYSLPPTTGNWSPMDRPPSS